MELERNEFDIVVVGGGPATRIFNKYMHLLNPGLETLVIRDEARIVNHCGTPYIVEGTIPWERGLIAEELVTRFGTPILVEPLVGGDPAAHEIETASGRRIRYRTLVLATGTDQVLPPIPGIELDRVLKVRRTEDLRRTIERLADVRHVTVLGAGSIGLEFAVALRKLGRDVTVVEMADHVMGGRIDTAMAEAIESHLASLGIELLAGRRATCLVGEDRVCAVEVDGGRRFDTDAVLSAVGVRPMIDYAPAMGLETAPDGIVVDPYFRTNLEDVHAIGDCVRTFSVVTGEPVPGKLGSNAGQMARRLALNLSGSARPFPGVVNAAVTRIEGLAYGGAGLSEADAEAAGIPVLVSRNTSTTEYDNMPGTRPVEVKLLYRADGLVLVGAEILGPFNPAGFVEVAAQLIERRATLEDVLTMSYSSHPELTPKTSKPYWVWGSEPLMRTLARTGRFPEPARKEDEA